MYQALGLQRGALSPCLGRIQMELGRQSVCVCRRGQAIHSDRHQETPQGVVALNSAFKVGKDGIQGAEKNRCKGTKSPCSISGVATLPQVQPPDLD